MIVEMPDELIWRHNLSRCITRWRNEESLCYHVYGPCGAPQKHVKKHCTRQTAFFLGRLSITVSFWHAQSVISLHRPLPSSHSPLAPYETRRETLCLYIKQNSLSLSSSLPDR